MVRLDYGDCRLWSSVIDRSYCEPMQKARVFYKIMIKHCSYWTWKWSGKPVILSRILLSTLPRYTDWNNISIIEIKILSLPTFFQPSHTTNLSNPFSRFKFSGLIFPSLLSVVFNHLLAWLHPRMSHFWWTSPLLSPTNLIFLSNPFASIKFDRQTSNWHISFDLVARTIKLCHLHWL